LFRKSAQDLFFSQELQVGIVQKIGPGSILLTGIPGRDCIENLRRSYSSHRNSRKA